MLSNVAVAGHVVVSVKQCDDLVLSVEEVVRSHALLERTADEPVDAN